MTITVTGDRPAATTVRSTLPPGFVIVPGTFKIDGAAALIPSSGPNNVVTLALGTLAPGVHTVALGCGRAGARAPRPAAAARAPRPRDPTPRPRHVEDRHGGRVARERRDPRATSTRATPRIRCSPRVYLAHLVDDRSRLLPLHDAAARDSGRQRRVDRARQPARRLRHGLVRTGDRRCCATRRSSGSTRSTTTVSASTRRRDLGARHRAGRAADAAARRHARESSRCRRTGAPSTRRSTLPSLAPGNYAIQISGYNGAFSSQPYSLRMTTTRRSRRAVRGAAAAELRRRPDRSPVQSLGTEPARAVPRSAAAAVRNVRHDGAPNRSSTASRRLAPSVRRDDSPGRQSRFHGGPQKYAAWDTNRCSVAAANDVVREIGKTSTPRA